MAGIYIHIPFCSQFCTYCDFYSVKAGKRGDAFIQALKSESESRKEFFRGACASPGTLYFGGGTPSLIDPVHIGEVAEIICDNHGFSKPYLLEEFTVEVNPDDASPIYLRRLYESGARRLSMGVQSFVDSHLKWMNRRHDSSTAIEAFHNAREAGFKNISIDLIFGFSLLTMDEWRHNLDRAIALKPEHISSYQLSIEKGTKLGKDYEKGSYIPVEDDLSYTQYSLLQRALADAGYKQYEVSSFALDGKEAIHNSRYWDRTPYLGLGPAAHSFDGVKRYGNKPSLGAYLKRYSPDELERSKLPGYKEEYVKQELLNNSDIFNETLMLSLRRVEGLDVDKLINNTSGIDFKSFMDDVQRQVALGDLEWSGRKIKIPSGKLFLSDGIIRELFRD